MPQHKSAEKRIRTAAKARLRNRAVKSKVKGALKTFDEAESPEQRDEALRVVSAELDRASRKGVLPARRVDRKKSRLALARNRAATSSS